MKKYLLLALLSISTVHAARIPLLITRPVPNNANIVVETYFKKKKYGNYHSVVYDANNPRSILFRQDSDSNKITRLLITHQIVENWAVVTFKDPLPCFEDGYCTQDFAEDGSVVELMSPKPRRVLSTLEMLEEKED